MVGIVMEEDIRFFFIYIQACCTYLTFLNALYKSLSIDQSASGSIQYNYSLLHLSNRRSVYHMPVLICQRAMQRDDVCPTPELIQRYIFNAWISSRKLIVSNNIHSKTTTDINKDTADLTCTDNANSLSVKIKAGHTLKAEIEVLCTDISLMDPADRCQEQSHCMLCNSIRWISRNTYYMNLTISILNINVVITGTTKRDELNSHSIKLVNNKGIDIVIYKYTDNITTFSQLICIRSQTSFKETDLKLPCTICSLKRLPVIFFGIEESYSTHDK